ncbi:MAG TPA: DUF3093 domain-containing protein [Pseudonocardia sp.]|jgi:hypothetical protein
MTLLRRATRAAPSGAARFDERLWVPWRYWLGLLAAVLLLTVTVRLGHPGVPVWVTPVALLAAGGTGLFRLGRTRVTVTGDNPGTGAGEAEVADGSGAAGPVLRVGPASLPLRFVAGASVVPATSKQAQLGPEFDPRAFLLHRAWLRRMVRVDLDDPDDPTPYWIFSVRDPEALLAALDAPRPR